MNAPSSDTPDAPKLVMHGIHVELSSALQSAITNKFEGIVRHENSINRLNVHLNKDPQLGGHPHFRATAHVERTGPDFLAEADGDDAYATLDKLSDQVLELVSHAQGKDMAERHHLRSGDTDSTTEPTQA